MTAGICVDTVKLLRELKDCVEADQGEGAYVVTENGDKQMEGEVEGFKLDN